MRSSTTAGGTGVSGMERPCRRAGARRKRKQVQIAEGQRADEFQRLFELAIRFAGKADHDVGAEGEVGAGGAEERGNLFRVVPGAVAAMHAAQHGVGARLQRQMGVAGEATCRRILP